MILWNIQYCIHKYGSQKQKATGIAIQMLEAID
jgi:hypothetical protein